jgi:hypothetical protein
MRGWEIMGVADDIRKSVGVASIAFGAAAALAPRWFLGAYGLPGEANVRVVTRLWGTRTAVLGALALTLDDADDRRRLMTLAAAMNSADASLLATASGVPARTRALGSLTAAGFAAALAYALTR